MRKAFRGLSHLTEGIAGLLMAAMFGTFLIQIAVRYGARYQLIDPAPYGWTLEFCLALWLWIVFLGNAFVVRERDHVTFDILYFWVRPAVRRWLAITGALIVGVGLLASIGPTYDKLHILRLKSSATLGVKMLPIYSIYFVFLAAVGLRYLWRAVDVFRNGVPGEGHHLPGVSGVSGE